MAEHNTATGALGECLRVVEGMSGGSIPKDIVLIIELLLEDNGERWRVTWHDAAAEGTSRTLLTLRGSRGHR